MDKVRRAVINVEMFWIYRSYHTAGKCKGIVLLWMMNIVCNWDKKEWMKLPNNVLIILIHFPGSKGCESHSPYKHICYDTSTHGRSWKNGKA